MWRAWGSNYLVRLNPDGSPDPTFIGTPILNVRQIQELADGKLMCVGARTNYNVIEPFRLQGDPVTLDAAFLVAGRIRFSGPPLRTYVLEKCITFPAWSAIATNTFTSMPMEFVTTPVIAPERFYRVRLRGW